MKLLKVTTNEGKNVIVNIDNVAYWYGRNETETTISFNYSDDFIIICIPIDEFLKRLEAFDDSRMVWVLN